MIHVELSGDMLTLKADTPTGTGEPRLVVAFPSARPFTDAFYFVTTHRKVKAGEGVRLTFPARLADPTTGIVYKLVPQEETE